MPTLSLANEHEISTQVEVSDTSAEAYEDLKNQRAQRRQELLNAQNGTDAEVELALLQFSVVCAKINKMRLMNLRLK